MDILEYKGQTYKSMQNRYIRIYMTVKQQNITWTY